MLYSGLSPYFTFYHMDLTSGFVRITPYDLFALLSLFVTFVCLREILHSLSDPIVRRVQARTARAIVLGWTIPYDVAINQALLETTQLQGGQGKTRPLVSS